MISQRISMMEYLERLMRSFKERDRLSTLLLLTYSPLPPLATARRTGVLLDEELEAAARRDTATGSREELSNLLRGEMERIQRRLESSSRNIVSVFSVVSITGTVIPAMVGTVAMFVSPNAAPGLILALAAATVLLSLTGLAVYPKQISIPWRQPWWAPLIPLAVAVTVTLLFQAVAPSFSILPEPGWGSPLGTLLVLARLTPLMGVAIGGAVGVFPALRSRRIATKLLHTTYKWLRGAASTPWSPLYGTGVSVDELESLSGWPLVDSMRKLISLSAIHGAPEALVEASHSYGRLVEAVKSFSARGLEMLAYCLVTMILSAASLSIGIESLNLMRSAPMSVAGLPPPPSPEELEPYLSLSLALEAVGLSLLTSLCREGNWRYYCEYLLVFALAASLGVALGPSLVGW